MMILPLYKKLTDNTYIKDFLPLLESFHLQNFSATYLNLEGNNNFDQVQNSLLSVFFNMYQKNNILLLHTVNLFDRKTWYTYEV